MLSETDIEKLAKAFPALARTHQETAARLVREAVRIQAGAGQTIFSESSRCGGFPLVVSGSIRVARSAPSGREILLYRVLPGEVCVLSTGCLLGNVEYPASGRAEEDVEAYLFPGQLFTALLNQDTAFRELVFGQFTARVTKLMELVEAIAFRRLDQRLASILVDRGPDIETTHQALAGELGSVREIVSRLLGDLEDRGFVKLGRGHILVVSMDELRVIAAGE